MRGCGNNQPCRVTLPPYSDWFLHVDGELWSMPHAMHVVGQAAGHRPCHMPQATRAIVHAIIRWPYYTPWGHAIGRSGLYWYGLYRAI